MAIDDLFFRGLVPVVAMVLTLAACAKEEESTLESACEDRCTNRVDCGAADNQEDCEVGCRNQIPSTKAMGEACVDATIAVWECEAGLSCDSINDSQPCHPKVEAQNEACVDL
jgi:hypothetical protein